MDTLVAEEGDKKAGEGETPAAPAAGADGGADDKGGAADAGAPPAPAGAGEAKPPAADSGDPAKPDAAADTGKPGDGAAPAAPTGGDLPETWTATAAELAPKLEALSTAFEERTLQAYQQTALDEIKVEHKQYFDALEQHPRTLVGKTVPAIGKEGNETLKDAADAADWQEAVKALLVGEVRERASKAVEENSEFLTTMHASIELFQKNPDLIPGTKDFDVELANRFAALAKPYELRVEEKLQGYSIPVQPLIDQLRNALVAERKAAPAAPAAASAPAAPKPEADPPQGGITSKAGASSEAEDFSTLFGTIGLPNLQI